MKNFGILVAFMVTVLIVNNANAVSILIGDVDGFGITNPNTWQSAQNTNPDTDGDGLLEAGEFLPDFDNDGHVWVNGSDEFDNRSGAEAAGTTGAQWTDISLEDQYNNFGNSPANDALFTFNFAVPVVGDADFGVDHYINLLFGDYDVTPAKLSVDGVDVSLTTQASSQDGLIQLAFATVSWADLLDGQVVIDVYAPNEPYLTIDYAFLNTEQGAPVPEPATMLLFGAGLVGFAGMRMRRKK